MGGDVNKHHMLARQAEERVLRRPLSLAEAAGGALAAVVVVDPVFSRAGILRG